MLSRTTITKLPVVLVSLRIVVISTFGARRLFSTTNKVFATKMATEQYIIIVPDHPSAPRLEVRPKHFSKIASEDSTVSNTLMGGAYLTSQPENLDATSWGFAGSAMVLELPAGAGEEGVKKWLREDPYSTGGVWDWEKARIIKFKAGVSNQKDLTPGK